MLTDKFVQHPAMDINAVRSLLSAAVDKVGSQRSFARLHRVSVPYVSRVLSGSMLPGEKILKALGLKRTVDYVPRKNGSAR